MLLLENNLSSEIKKLLGSETKLRIAVAFIGNGASQLIGPQAKDVKIICNLTMGGTNPNEIKTLINRFGRKSVRQIDNLHAKLYIGTEYAIVGSANMSTNGLGNQPSALREAGYKFKLDQSSGNCGTDWFDTLWGKASNITNRHLKDAVEKWEYRNRARNGDWKSVSGDICDYDFDRDDFPLLEWIGDSDWEVVGNNKSSLGDWGTLEDAIDKGVEIDCDDDIDHLQADRWILKFHRRSNASPIWIQLSRTILANSFKYDGDDETMSVALSKRGFVSGPFTIDEEFVDKFRDLLFHSVKYKALIDNNYKGCWFHPRIKLMRKFWKELQSRLCKEKNRAVTSET